MAIQPKQWFQISTGLISGLITGAALLTTLFGQDLTIKIVAALGVANIIVSAVGLPLLGQAATIKDVLAMPGVQKVEVNDKANQTLASMAMDPNVNKISPTDEALDKVTATAKGT